MLGTASALTIVTLTGLAAGFAREWLLVAGWGAGGRTDAFLVAMFLPEALRTILAGGLLSSVGLSLWNERPEGARAAWLSSTTASLGLLSVFLVIALAVAASFWIWLIGPGLSAEQHTDGVQALRLLAWSMPGIVLQAWWSVPLQSEARFLLPGFGSLLFNLPSIAYMMATKHDATEPGLALCFVVGSVLMTVPLVAPVLRLGLHTTLLRPRTAPLRELGGRLLPLAGSSLISQGLLLLERIIASYLGEGSLTVLNLARKLINVPLVALTSLNQVLLGLMSRQVGGERLDLLRRGIATITTVSLPAAVVLILGSDAIVRLLFGAIPGNGRIQPLLALYAVAVTFAGWNAMLARFNYAAGDTRTPFNCELAGSLLQAICLPLLAWQLGTVGAVVPVLLGTWMTGFLLTRQPRLKGRLGIFVQTLVCALALGAAAAAMSLVWQPSATLQLVIASAVGALCMLLLALWLQPWKRGVSKPAGFEQATHPL